MHWRTKEKSSEPFHGPEDFFYCILKTTRWASGSKEAAADEEE